MNDTDQESERYQFLCEKAVEFEHKLQNLEEKVEMIVSILALEN